MEEPVAKYDEHIIEGLGHLALDYIEKLPKCTRPLAKRLLLRESTSARSVKDMGFLQYVRKVGANNPKKS